MVSALLSGLSSPGLSPGWGHFYSHSASQHPGVLTGTGELNAGGSPAMD